MQSLFIIMPKFLLSALLLDGLLIHLWKTNGKNYITPDVDGHNGGIWKMGESVKALQNGETRMGTYNANLKRIGD